MTAVGRRQRLLHGLFQRRLPHPGGFGDDKNRVREEWDCVERFSYCEFGICV